MEHGEKSRAMKKILPEETKVEIFFSVHFTLDFGRSAELALCTIGKKNIVQPKGTLPSYPR
jgi:hypothetical protein